MWFDILQILIYLILLILLAIPVGHYIARVFNREKTFLDPVLNPIEEFFYKIARINPTKEMTWKEYAFSLTIFNICGIVFLYILQRIQGILPFNPQHLKAVRPDLAFNTAVSFVTNTNWQSYVGERQLSYFTQMVGLTVQNFLSAATGMAVALALIRGFIRKETPYIGNFWVDMTRTVLWLLLPLSFVLAIVLVSQGVIQNFSPYLKIATLEGKSQTLPMGPVASQEAIKLLGTNGGGFFGANSAHPFENPSPLTNFIEMLAIQIIPAAMPIAFGRFIKNKKEGIIILNVMLVLFILDTSIIYLSEYYGNPIIHSLGISQPAALEGKEVRFGIGGSALFTSVTTAVACGAVNNMHDSLTPLAGMIALLQIMLGEVIFGGIGVGLCGILIFAIFTVFIIGLMIGRTPEYLGKKIEAKEIKMATLAVIIPSAAILLGSALSVSIKEGLSSISNAGPHGLTEILYAFSSASGNNGSAFAGLKADTAYYNILLGIVMLIGRFGTIIPSLAIAGSLASKKRIPVSAGTFQSATPIFGVLLGLVILIVGGLTFFPAIALGPVLEHLLMLLHKLF
ncbi:potassium-transporting ATPase subunit KdpA [Caldicellulosiruptor acetigenus]|uniref:potassium-transporting ATPase subunit KdpA n=1 Tax=Caldicellulosiruptor acetigenus TaxID=301953 RepID=UPI0004041E30|nr:potassium-transporting ATPase subunit KdpA [Caldicellulosiruptor acetigenus]WAM35689.1 potassium-transporting ATPase subunit KdpA [Caldicellulosiruptor acetigenus]